MISALVFIRDNNAGAFCLWESMSVIMPLVDEFIVWDMGSTDGTWETLEYIAERQPKLKISKHEWPINPVTNLIDAGSFAVIPNEMMKQAKNELVWYYQADEIWHEDLIDILKKKLENLNDFRGFSFWRYQLQDNFQRIKWFPHIVHRIDYKNRFTFVDDGMNSNRYNDAELVSNYTGTWFTRWGAEYSKGRKERVDHNGQPYIYGNRFREITTGKHAHEMPTNEMILDVSSVGGFLENIILKRTHHAPMWRTSAEEINIDGIAYNMASWYKDQKKNPDWTKKDSPFNIPEIMRPLLGMYRYPIRQELIEKICKS